MTYRVAAKQARGQFRCLGGRYGQQSAVVPGIVKGWRQAHRTSHNTARVCFTRATQHWRGELEHCAGPPMQIII